jgi:dTDP-4-dehydrorhamnose 3,5-epimerase
MIEGIKIFPLKQIELDKGDVWHGLKNTDDSYCGFGEVYFSNIKPNQIKGWKKHQLNTLNLIVLKGTIEFVFFDDRIDSKTKGNFQSIIASEHKENYIRICVPPGLWMAFKGKSEEQALLMDIINQPHSDNESIRKDLDDIKYNW